MRYKIIQAESIHLSEIMEIEYLAQDSCLKNFFGCEGSEESSNTVLIYKDSKDNVLGYIMYSLGVDDDENEYCLITRLATHPSCWRRGVARALVGQVKQIARCISSKSIPLRLVVRLDQAVIGFDHCLSRLGFQFEKSAGCVSIYYVPENENDNE